MTPSVKIARVTACELEKQERESNRAADPITTAVVHNTLLTTAKEMRETIQRTSFSPVIYEDRDSPAGCWMLMRTRSPRLLA